MFSGISSNDVLSCRYANIHRITWLKPVYNRRVATQRRVSRHWWRPWTFLGSKNQVSGPTHLNCWKIEQFLTYDCERVARTVPWRGRVSAVSVLVSWSESCPCQCCDQYRDRVSAVTLSVPWPCSVPCVSVVIVSLPWPSHCRDRVSSVSVKKIFNIPCLARVGCVKSGY